MLENQGYKRLSKQKREESIEEMKHADEVIQRIPFWTASNMQRLFSVRVGENNFARAGRRIVVEDPLAVLAARKRPCFSTISVSSAN